MLSSRKSKSHRLCTACSACSAPEIESQLKIYDLFDHYNTLYFTSSLAACSVEWSSRLTRVAGTCFYQNDGRCEIHLSKLLLKNHSDDDLKNTLLHEMIHAFLWKAENNKDHSDHGPSFKSLMKHINSRSLADDQRPPIGYNITINHMYHEEDDRCKRHHWMCVECGDLIKRSINKRPGPLDCSQHLGHQESCDFLTCHWHMHKKACEGHYVKIAEPSGYKQKKLISVGKAQVESSEELDQNLAGGLLCLLSQNISCKRKIEGNDVSDVRSSKRVESFSPVAKDAETLAEYLAGGLLCLPSSSGNCKQKLKGKNEKLHVRSKRVESFYPIAKDACANAAAFDKDQPRSLSCVPRKSITQKQKEGKEDSSVVWVSSPFPNYARLASKAGRIVKLGDGSDRDAKERCANVANFYCGVNDASKKPSSRKARC